MGGWQGALGAIGNTASNWASTPNSGSGTKKSATDGVVAAQQAAKKIADAIKSSSGYTDDAGMSDTIHNKKHTAKKDGKKHAKTCNKKHVHKKACK